MPTRLNLTQVSRRLSDSTPFLRLILRELRVKVLPVLQDNTPGKTLPDEWTHKEEVSKNKAELIIFNRRLEGDRSRWEPIFHYLNEGTRTHWIEPVNAKALRWEDELGNVHFSKGHMVSGILPAYFAEQADRIVSDFEKTLGKKWRVWIETGRYV